MAVNKKNILIIMTNYDGVLNGKKTGWFLPELAHPWNVLKDTCAFTFASPKGGLAPCDEGSKVMFKDDLASNELLANEALMKQLSETRILTEISTAELDGFDAVLIPGGHGPMFDLATDPSSQKAIAYFFEKGKIVASVCHGPACLVNIKLSTGEMLLKGKKVTAFSNVEEEQVQLTKAMPFSLEDKLVEAGGIFSKAKEAWEGHTVVDGNLITGQNPNSATGVGELLAQHLTA